MRDIEIRLDNFLIGVLSAVSVGLVAGAWWLTYLALPGILAAIAANAIFQYRESCNTRQLIRIAMAVRASVEADPPVRPLR